MNWDDEVYIPDPVELLEAAVDRQMDLIDGEGKYPCCKCGRRYLTEDMHPVSDHPATPLECGLEDCEDKPCSE